MYYQVAIFIIVLFGLTVRAQTTADTINIRGKVTCGDKGVSGAVVTLTGQNMQDTTDADGTYMITKNIVGVVKSLIPSAEKIIFRNGILKLYLPQSSSVKIEIYDVKGELIKKKVSSNTEAGIYHMNIAEVSRTSQLYVIHASINKRTFIYRYLPLHNGRYALSYTSAGNTTSSGGRLAKVTANAVDTLEVTKMGFETKKVPLKSFNDTVNIAIDSVDDKTLKVRLDETRQTIDGFGINNNWKPLGSSGINACFDSVNGLGLSILRIGMLSSGGLFQSNNWNDVKDATAKGCKYIIGSTWSPPGSWKSGQTGGAGSENGGGHLNDDKYEEWADRIASFPAKVKQNTGVDLYAMSIGNEPDFASCGSNEPCNGMYPTTLFNAEEMVKFIKIAGPKLQQAGCKVIAPEASEWSHIWSDTSGCCSVPSGRKSSDPLHCECFTGKTDKCVCAAGKGYSYGKYLYEDKDAWAALDILGVHQYDTQKAEPWPDYVEIDDRKQVWQTEMSGVKWWPEGSPDGSIENGIAVAGWIHDALTVGEANAWLYWWYNGGGNTNEGLLINGQDTKRHYTFGNFTRFVRPGYKRVKVTGDVPVDILLSAYKGDDGTVVIVAINKGSQASVPITIAGGSPSTEFTPWVTSENDNLKKKNETVRLDGSVLTVQLEEKSVMTFVGKSAE